MKKLLVSFIICLIGIGIFSTNLIFAESNEVSVYLNGKEIQFDVKPQTINGRTMVPIRSIFETMGASVLWDDATQTAISTKEDTTIKMTIDSKIMYINNQAISMDVSPIVINGRTLAPARYVAE